MKGKNCIKGIIFPHIISKDIFTMTKTTINVVTRLLLNTKKITIASSTNRVTNICKYVINISFQLQYVINNEIDKVAIQSEYVRSLLIRLLHCFLSIYLPFHLFHQN